MKIKITKSHGTQNSFVIVYNNENHDLIKSKIKKICHEFNTDGFLLISDFKGYDYKMDYFNNDGSWETMCANGARCAALYMYNFHKCNKNITFLAGDGQHKIKINDSSSIELSMKKPFFKTKEIQPCGHLGRYVDSGAKHYISMVDKIEIEKVKSEGAKIRYNKLFEPYGGINVNFLEVINEHHIKVSTYEKGIENMVLSCGSGSVAAAYYAFNKNKIKSPLKISVPGGELKLSFDINWDNVWLSGPAFLYHSKTFVL